MLEYKEESYETLKRLGVDEHVGLNKKQVIKHREMYGANIGIEKKKKSLTSKMIEAMKDPMIIILLIATGITLVINTIKYYNGYEAEFIEGIGIIVAIALTLIITLVMEGKSEKAFELLSAMKEAIQVKVLREGSVTLINQRELVVGDIVLLSTGDKVMVDGRLIEASHLEVDESSLTGESLPVKKQTNKCMDEAVIAERYNMLYSGSFIVSGMGKMVVTQVGTHTEFGKIVGALAQPKESNTPLQEKLGRLGKIITLLGGICAVITFVLQLGMSQSPINLEVVSEAFISAIALIVAAVPEGLSTIVAASLAINVMKLSKQNALVKKMIACETIGAINVICSDKTGTLTENKMTVITLQQETPSSNLNQNHDLINICINSTANLKIEGEAEEKLSFIGSPTECALLKEAKQRGMDYRSCRANAEVIYTEPFSSEVKKMTTIVEHEGNYIVYTKGSPEKILMLCDLEASRKKELEALMYGYQKKACRLIAFCHKIVALEELNREDIENLASYEKHMIYDGFAVITDPLRKETYDAVLSCKEAGIEFKMLTGDNVVTAGAIAKELDIIGPEDKVVEARELESLDDESFRKIIPHVRVIARSTPLIKMRVVETLKSMGSVVAVTGDGINDAPALKRADVGIAMGISGTEVSKEASDMILLDDSFSTITKAIEWGRGLYDNFQRFIQFQLTVNISAVALVVISLLMGLKAPFTALQLLWINIVMDGPPALTLGLEPISSEVMKRSPVERKASIVSKEMLKSILRNGAIISILCLLQSHFNFLGALEQECATVIFSFFMVCHLFNAFNSKKLTSESGLKHAFKNKQLLGGLLLTFILQVIITQYGGAIFNTVPLSMSMWLKILGTAMLVIVFDEIYRWIERCLSKKNNNNKRIRLIY